MNNSNAKPRTRCVSCGGYAYDTTIGEDISIRHDGKLYQIRVENLPVSKCESCGEVYYDNRADSATQNELRTHLGLLLPEQIVALREARGLTQADVSRDTGIAAETLSRWENGRVIQSKSHDTLLRAYMGDLSLFRRAMDLTASLVRHALSSVGASTLYSPASTKALPVLHTPVSDDASTPVEDRPFSLAA